MKRSMFKQTILVIPFILMSASCYYYIELKDDGPIVKGGTIHFYVTAYDGDQPSKSTFEYEWQDNAIPQHVRETDKKGSTDEWLVTYQADDYPMGTYRVQVSVKFCVIGIICYEVGSARADFNITGTLNGVMHVVQKNDTRTDDFVSSTDTVIHEVDIKKSDWDYISKAPTVLTYWFVDCTYYGITTDLKFPFNYTKPDEEHYVEALVVADFTPLPPPTTTMSPNTTTTTTTKPTSTPATTTTTTTTAKPTTATAITTKKPNNTLVATTLNPDTSSVTTKTLIKRSVGNSTDIDKISNSRIMIKVNGTLVPYNVTFPFVCNGSHVVTDSQKTYGFFYKRIKVKAPIAKVNVTGNNWIQHGDLLSLQVKCSGSQTIEYCVTLLRGSYNVTGNETCKVYDQLDNCDFPIKRYLAGNKYTVLIIIKNEVSKTVTPVAVTIYEVKKQAQLSVIVVPVAFSLVAVVLIVFGVAYYIQNRSRFIIEVADFNFGQQYTDMEYKTFKERLKDSIVNAFTRGPSPSSSEVPVWPPGRKYGSMT